MAKDVDVEAVLEGRPTAGVLLRRGLAKHCPRCGGGKVYESWFRMKERCPTCGFLFEREPGFFVGAYLINFAIAEGFLFVLIMAFLALKNARPETGVGWPIVAGLTVGVVAPIVFYPFSRTIWSAIDLAMTPLEVPEIVAAADAVAPGSRPAEVDDEGGPVPEG